MPPNMVGTLDADTQELSSPSYREQVSPYFRPRGNPGSGEQHVGTIDGDAVTLEEHPEGGLGYYKIGGLRYRRPNMVG